MFWIPRGPIETMEITKNHPRLSIHHFLRADTRVRKNNRRKACTASINDLATILVDGIVGIQVRFSPHRCPDVAKLLDTAWGINSRESIEAMRKRSWKRTYLANCTASQEKPDRETPIGHP